MSLLVGLEGTMMMCNLGISFFLLLAFFYLLARGDGDIEV